MSILRCPSFGSVFPPLPVHRSCGDTGSKENQRAVDPISLRVHGVAELLLSPMRNEAASSRHVPGNSDRRAVGETARPRRA